MSNAGSSGAGHARQVGFADMLILNKVGLAGPEQVEKVRAWLNEHFNRLPRRTVESADEVARMIVNTYRAPNKTLPDLEDMVNRGAIDMLQTFSDTAQEFHRLGV